ncbi:WXG100 family type VII secretion target [Micromonospora sp. NPDC049102]|uniref:WXG100 family type VII secretion target n=1 Tax=Micromonospora sp. NPDC049102 TaxID=3364265 RepID=UPI003720A6A9
MPDPSSSSLRVPLELEMAGSQLNGKAAEIVSELDALKSKLQPLSETWQGDAKTYYEGLQGEWNLAADGLFGPEGVLGLIASALNLNWNNYSRCEWECLNTWRPRGA